MANLIEIAELAYNKIYPNPTIDTPIKLEEFIATAKSEFAYQIWRKSKEDKREDSYSLPSYLVSMDELTVVDNKASIKHLKPLKSLDFDQWLVNIGGLECKCVYIKSDVNMAQLMCDDDSIGNAKRYIPIKDQILFPNGTHANTLPILYVSNGIKIDNYIEVDDGIGALVRRHLLEFYGQKVPEDVTKNSNPNN
jgi:hypothetical protein